MTLQLDSFFPFSRKQKTQRQWRQKKRKEKTKSCPQEMAQNAVQIIHIILCECSPKDTSGCCSRSLDCHKHPSGRLWAWTKSFGVLNWMGCGKCAECANALGSGSNYHEMLLCSLCVVMESRVYLGKTAAFREPLCFGSTNVLSYLFEPCTVTTRNTDIFTYIQVIWYLRHCFCYLFVSWLYKAKKVLFFIKFH